MSSTVSAELRLQVHTPEQTIQPLVTHFFYSRQDPYAIRITFRLGLDQPVEWIFARDLLATGIEGLEGLGDVMIWPSAGSAGSVLNIVLSCSNAQAHFEAPVGEISDFLGLTYQIVPAGEESEHLDVEAELNDLLRQAS
jgi:hypothetical protein